MLMFTDMAETDPFYFYMRGVFYGFTLATFMWLVAVPWIRRKLSERRFDLQARVRNEGRRAYLQIARRGVFEGSGTLGVVLGMASKNNPYKKGTRKADLWHAGFVEYP
jgi:hypothetical protein